MSRKAKMFEGARFQSQQDIKLPPPLNTLTLYTHIRHLRVYNWLKCLKLDLSGLHSCFGLFDMPMDHLTHLEPKGNQLTHLKPKGNQLTLLLRSASLASRGFYSKISVWVNWMLKI